MYKLFTTLPAFLFLTAMLNAQTVTMPGCDPVWRYSVTGSGIGANRMQCHDYDGDGNVELIIGSHNYGDYKCNYWYKMEYDRLSGKFEQVWVSRYYGYEGDGPTVIESVDCDNDGEPEIILGFTNSVVEVYHGATMQMEATFEIPSWDEEAIYRILKADADNDGEVELVFCTMNATYLMKTGSYASDSKYWYGSKNMRCGNVDADPSLELVYLDGSVVRITNGQAQLLQDFTDPTYYSGNILELYDMDSDGMKEILYNEPDLVVYDADTKTEKFRIEEFSSYDIEDILFADTQTGNGVEMILGCDYGPEFYNMEGVLDRKLYDYDLSGTIGMNIADLNDDGINELVFASGYGSSASDHLNIYNFQTNQITWQSPESEGPFFCLKFADTDNDGSNEMIFLNDTYNTSMTCMDAVTREIEWQVTGDPYYGDEITAFDVADFDNDGDQEIVLLTKDWGETVMKVVNARTQITESQHLFENHSFSNIIIRDADLDGMQEFITNNSDYLYIINPLDYSIVWQSSEEWAAQGSSGRSYLETANTDNDQNTEIIWSRPDLLIIDGFTKQIESEVTDLMDVSLYDLEKDGISEVFYADWNYYEWTTTIGYLDRQTGDKKTLRSLNDHLDELVLFEVPGRTDPLIAIFESGELTFMTMDTSGITEPCLMSSGSYYTTSDELLTTDFDNDGVSELFAITYDMISEFDVACYLPLSMNEPPSGSVLQVFPNPAGETITIGVRGSTGLKALQDEALIINSCGQVVMHLPAGSLTAGVGNLCPGLYLIKAISGDRQFITKFIKD